MNGLERVVEPAVVICGDPLFRCRCVKLAGHVDAGDEVHACSEEVCGGSWKWLDDVRFVGCSMPRGTYEGAAVPPPPDVSERVGRPFVQCNEDGSEYVPPPLFSFPRGGIKYFLPATEDEP